MSAGLCFFEKSNTMTLILQWAGLILPIWQSLNRVQTTGNKKPPLNFPLAVFSFGGLRYAIPF
jgi:hypothetical protein